MSDLDIINESLEFAAEKLGDFTPQVFERFYERFPDAKTYFNRAENLEGNMLAEVVFCMLEHLEAPAS